MRGAKLFIVLALVAALLPFLYTCFYAMPFADDFCFGWTSAENISFIHKFLNQYLHWNGRYTSDVLVNLHPLATGNLTGYQLVAFFSIIALPAVIFILARNRVDGTINQLLTALFFTLFYLCYLPDLTEGVYWYIGLVNYHWGALCFILQLAVLYRLLYAPQKQVSVLMVSLALLVVSIGFNEVAAAIIPVYYMAAVIYLKALKKNGNTSPKLFNTIALHFAVAFIASAFVVCSPGNFTREGEFPQRFHLIHSLWFAGLQTARFTAQWALSVPFVALSILVIVFSGRVKQSVLWQVDYRLYIVLLLFTVFTSAFLPYMATGILGQHRTMNYVLPFFMLLWLCTLISFAHRFGLSEKISSVRSRQVTIIATTAAIVFIACSNTCYTLEKDIVGQKFENYKTQFLKRQDKVIHNMYAPIAPIPDIPNSFQVVDTKNDTSYWVDKCMKRYYTQTGVVLH